MKNLRLALTIAAAIYLILVAGCVPPYSLSPIFTDEDLAFDQELVGIWTMNDAKWEFKHDSGDYYHLTNLNEDGISTKFVAYLGKIKDTLYLDVLPFGESSDANEDSRILTIPVHMFFKVKKTESTWELYMMNPEWFEQYIEDNPDAISYWSDLSDTSLFIPSAWGSDWLITASTEDLQDFLIKIEDIEEAYNQEEPFILQRAEPEEKKP